MDGAFSAGGRHVFLRGVNYWPRFITGIAPGDFNGQSWLEAAQYDPDLIEADLTSIAALHFNLVNIQFSDFEGFWAQEGRVLIDFLERCRNHGIWVQVSLRTTRTNAAYAGQISSTLESYRWAAYLPGNDRVFAYELLWEPMIGTHDKGGQGRLVNGALVYNAGRLVLDPDWRTWLNEQYGSVAKAQQAWGFTAPLGFASSIPMDVARPASGLAGLRVCRVALPSRGDLVRLGACSSLRSWLASGVPICGIDGAECGARRWPRLGLGKLLVVLQVALSILLLIGAGLFVRTLRNLRAQDLGMDRKHLLLLWTTPGQTGRQGRVLTSFVQTGSPRACRTTGCWKAVKIWAG